MLTEEKIRVALEFRSRPPRDPEGPRKVVWLIDCFRYRTQPEGHSPKGCFECSHYKELKELY